MWTDPDRQWVGSALPCDDSDMALFRASTSIVLGNGHKALFWHDDWTGKGPLRMLTPGLYKISTRKQRTVSKELHEDNWIRSVARLQSPIHLQEFISIASLTSQVTLSTDREDSISWRWTTNGIYSAASAYTAQFSGSFPRFSPTKIWEAHAEPKCKLFSWLVLHGKILTADMLAIRGWPHDPTCPLCLGAPETATHLCKDCPFAIAVWSHVQAWTGEAPTNMMTIPPPMGVSDWWDRLICPLSKDERRRRSGHFLYTIWNIWKERNRRIFIGTRLTHLEVAAIALDDIRMRACAFGRAQVETGIG